MQKTTTKKAEKTKSRMVEVLATSAVLVVLGYAQHLHQVELDRRGIWIDSMDKFRSVVEARTSDRWTRSQHDKWVEEFCRANNLKKSLDSGGPTVKK